MKSRSHRLSKKIRHKLRNKNTLNQNMGLASAQAYPISYRPPQGCPEIFPGPPPSPPENILKVETFQYTALSDGVKNVYMNADGFPEFDSSPILDPQEVSYVNLFINGLLQPPSTYTVQPGILTLTEVPNAGAPIILQFVIIYG